jgi:hypothetical protein
VVKKKEPRKDGKTQNQIKQPSICTNSGCILRKKGCKGFEGCPGYKGK